MALGETTVAVAGIVTSDPEFKRIGGARRELLTFWLRSTERRFDKDKGEWVDGRHLSAKVKCWGRHALAVRSAFVKGDPVLVTGRMSCAEHVSESKQSRSLLEVEATAIGLNLMRRIAPVDRGERPDAHISHEEGRSQRQALIEKVAVEQGAEPVRAG
ncbi:single-stranded DNA-binding protein [Amycolatopsis alkalitolerans]|uniref:Single-stranded DNA-binding protein n=1 Tax=Amycolatopsis alkalitolerans TaxID=2547244 RepID=A0A5C4LZM8_9PSEU|nr:single-stranded DNA-binding protein [Amycolatopsis alkalitolerans]TNC24313.1 single-stranded DNA-binding protein [Amycolatopsis alkalitolerans]